MSPAEHEHPARMGPRVFEGEARAPSTSPRGESGAPAMTPQVTMTERSERVAPAEVASVPALPPAPPRHRGAVSLGLTGLGIFFAGWLAVDAYWWIAAAFERSSVLGALAATAVAGGVAGAGAIIAREVKSLWRLRSVETVRAQLAADV